MSLESQRLTKKVNDLIATVKEKIENVDADQSARLDELEKRMAAFEEANKPKKDKKGE